MAIRDSDNGVKDGKEGTGVFEEDGSCVEINSVTILETIPNSWNLQPLGEIVDFLDGKRRPVKDSDRAKMRGDIPYYGASGIVDYVNGYLFDEPLILLGEDGENILSRTCRLAFKVTGKTWVNNHAHVLRPKEGINIDYLTNYLESLNFEQYNTGTAQPKLNKQTCYRISILIPQRFTEQTAIATALSDTDALIRSLEKLIAKKRAIKQGAMQELLTGKRRLPGFERKWDKPSLGDLFTFKNGLNKEKKNFGYGTPIVNYMDVYKSRGIFSKHLQGRVNVTNDEKKAFVVRKGDVFFTRTSETVQEVGLASVVLDEAHETVFSGFVLRARPKDARLDDQYKKYCFSTVDVRDQIISQSTETTRALTSGKNLSLIKIACPPKAEQVEIAAILSSMDSELATLERKLSKLRSIKQGMMQELLTGKTRLV